MVLADLALSILNYPVLSLKRRWSSMNESADQAQEQCQVLGVPSVSKKARTGYVQVQDVNAEKENATAGVAAALKAATDTVKSKNGGAESSGSLNAKKNESALAGESLNSMSNTTINDSDTENNGPPAICDITHFRSSSVERVHIIPTNASVDFIDDLEFGWSLQRGTFDVHGDGNVISLIPELRKTFKAGQWALLPTDKKLLRRLRLFALDGPIDGIKTIYDIYGRKPPTLFSYQMIPLKNFGGVIKRYRYPTASSQNEAENKENKAGSSAATTPAKKDKKNQGVYETYGYTTFPTLHLSVYPHIAIVDFISKYNALLEDVPDSTSPTPSPASDDAFLAFGNWVDLNATHILPPLRNCEEMYERWVPTQKFQLEYAHLPRLERALDCLVRPEDSGTYAEWNELYSGSGESEESEDSESEGEGEDAVDREKEPEANAKAKVGNKKGATGKKNQPQKQVIPKKDEPKPRPKKNKYAPEYFTESSMRFTERIYNWNWTVFLAQQALSNAERGVLVGLLSGPEVQVEVEVQPLNRERETVKAKEKVVLSDERETEALHQLVNAAGGSIAVNSSARAVQATGRGGKREPRRRK